MIVSAPAASWMRIELLDPGADVADVDLVGDRVAAARRCRPRRARTLPCPCSRARPISAAAWSQAFIRCLWSRARAPRQRPGEQAGGRLRALEQEAVPSPVSANSCESARLRRAPSPVLRLAVEGGHRGGRVQAQVVADRGPADLRAHQQRRRLDRAAGDDDDRRPDGEPGRRAVGSRRSGSLQLASTPAARPFSTRIRSARAAGDDLGAASPARRAGRSSRSSASSRTGRRSPCRRRSPGRSARDPRCGCTARKSKPSFSQPSRRRSCGPVRSEHSPFTRSRSQTGVEVARRTRARRGPRGRARAAHSSRTQGVGAQAVRPVDDGAAADAGPGDDRDLALGGRERPAVQVEALVGGELEADRSRESSW